MTDTREFEDSLDREIREKVAPERPRRQTAERRPRKSRRLRGRILMGVGVLSVGVLLAEAADIIDIPTPGLSPSPGQAVGKTVISDADVVKFRATSSDALGEATIKVKEIKQEWIDKLEKGEKDPVVHETMYLENGKYTGQWVVAGKWQASKQDNGNLIVTLPAVTGKDVVTLEDPVIDQSRTGRALWQALGGALGGDDSDDATPRKNTRKMLGDWVKDPRESGNFHKAVACVALAGASSKAAAFSLSTPVNVQTFDVNPTAPYTPDPLAPTIEFQIPDPEETRSMLTINSCLPTLYGMGYDSNSQSTKDGEPYGMATHTIAELVLPAKVQG